MATWEGHLCDKVWYKGAAQHNQGASTARSHDGHQLGGTTLRLRHPLPRCTAGRIPCTPPQAVTIPVVVLCVIPLIGDSQIVALCLPAAASRGQSCMQQFPAPSIGTDIELDIYAACISCVPVGINLPAYHVFLWASIWHASDGIDSICR